MGNSYHHPADSMLGVHRLQHVTRVHVDPLHRYILLSLSPSQSALFSQLLQHAMAATLVEKGSNVKHISAGLN